MRAGAFRLLGILAVGVSCSIIACSGGGGGGSSSSTTAASSVSPASIQVSYAESTVNAALGVPIVPVVPTITGEATSFSISPALPSGLAFDSATGTISGTPATASAAASYTITASSASGSASTVILLGVLSSQTASLAVPGFMGLWQDFPSTALYASSDTATVMAGNPWMSGGRFFVSHENLCLDAAPPLNDWNADLANVSGFTDPMNEVVVRMTADPDAAWNIQNASSATYMDDVVAGVVKVGNAANTTSYMLDPENYATQYLLNNFSQTSSGRPLLNSPTLSRAAMCAQVQAFGKAFGTSLWSRVPSAKLYMFFGSSVVLNYTNGGTGIPASFPDASYASNSEYNMFPYFCLGLLDACPSTGRIIDYCEASFYTFTGLASIQRNLTASKNWVSIFFPGQTALIAKSATVWIPVPMIFVNPYFDASYGSIFPGAYYVHNSADQLHYFTRNCLYCLQQTPAGYLPGVYIETYDPWGRYGTVSNIPASWQTGLNTALAIYRGSTTLASQFNASTLNATLESAFAGDSAWVAECH